MNALEFLLTHVQEECGEITQAAAKILRFGLDSRDPRTGEINVDKFVKELNDLQGIIELLKQLPVLEGLPGLHDPEAVQNKIKKVLRYARDSQALGILTEDLPGHEHT